MRPPSGMNSKENPVLGSARADATGRHIPVFERALHLAKVPQRTTGNMQIPA